MPGKDISDTKSEEDKGVSVELGAPHSYSFDGCGVNIRPQLSLTARTYYHDAKSMEVVSGGVLEAGEENTGAETRRCFSAPQCAPPGWSLDFCVLPGRGGENSSQQFL